MTSIRRAHQDDIAFDNFAWYCKNKLYQSREKGRYGWEDPIICTDESLARLLVEHLLKGNPGTFEDIANFAMMLHHRGADPRELNLAVKNLFETITDEELTRVSELPYNSKEICQHFRDKALERLKSERTD